MIQTIRETQPVYNLITNNCQTYALQLLDAIKAVGVDEFATTLAIYERIVGPGRVADLFVTGSDDELAQDHAFAPPGRQDTVSFAQQVMVDNTAQLDTKEELNKSTAKKKKKNGGSIFSAFSRK